MHPSVMAIPPPGESAAPVIGAEAENRLEELLHWAEPGPADGKYREANFN